MKMFNVEVTGKRSKTLAVRKPQIRYPNLENSSYLELEKKLYEIKE